MNMFKNLLQISAANNIQGPAGGNYYEPPFWANIRSGTIL